MLTIREAHREGEELDAYRKFLREHREATGVDFNTKGYEEELIDPLARYAPPTGVIAICYWDGEACAMGAIQDHGNGKCELSAFTRHPFFADEESPKQLLNISSAVLLKADMKRCGWIRCAD